MPKSAHAHSSHRKNKPPENTESLDDKIKNSEPYRVFLGQYGESEANIMLKIQYNFGDRFEDAKKCFRRNTISIISQKAESLYFDIQWMVKDIPSEILQELVKLHKDISGNQESRAKYRTLFKHLKSIYGSTLSRDPSNLLNTASTLFDCNTPKELLEATRAIVFSMKNKTAYNTALKDPKNFKAIILEKYEDTRTPSKNSRYGWRSFLSLNAASSFKESSAHFFVRPQGEERETVSEVLSEEPSSDIESSVENLQTVSSSSLSSLGSQDQQTTVTEESEPSSAISLFSLSDSSAVFSRTTIASP